MLLWHLCRHAPNSELQEDNLFFAVSSKTTAMAMWLEIYSEEKGMGGRGEAFTEEAFFLISLFNTEETNTQRIQILDKLYILK